MAMADNVHSLKSMILSFRVAELQMLLGYAGKAKSGKKNELQAQALELLKGRSLTIGVQNKIKELHRLRTNSVTGAVSSSTEDHSSQSHHLTNGVTTRSGAGHNMPAHVNQPTNSPLHHISSTHQSQIAKHMSPSRAISSPVSSRSNSSHSTDYYGSMPRSLGLDFNKPSYSQPPNLTMQYPVCPDVKFKSLPFYDVLGELLKSSSLNKYLMYGIVPSASSRFQESTFSFHLTPQQANDIAMSRELQPGAKYDYSVQVQLRFCLLETSCEQEDNFPPSICVKVNSKMCPLPNPLPTNKPGVEPKRPSRPVNITTLCKLSPTVPNQISISWASYDYSRPYAVGIFLVRKLTSQILLERIKKKGIRNVDHTKAMIKEKLAHDPDSEIATMSLRGSLLCPLGKMRITIPCRAITCAHVQCFDALLYLQMNEKKPTWICPVCDKPATFSNLSIDGLFTEIINEAPLGCNEVQFHEDGSWTPVAIKKENCETLNIKSKNISRRCSTPDDIPEKKKKKIDVITIESSSDEDDDDDEMNKSSSSVVPTTPVLSSGSGSESDTQTQSLPSPDSSSTTSVNAIPINQRSNSYYHHSMPTLTAHHPLPSTTATSPPALNLSRSDVNYNANGSYSNMPMPVMSPNSNPYYSSNNYHSDYLSQNNPFAFEPNFDINSTLNQLFRNDPQVPSYFTSSSAHNRRQTHYDPNDIISID